MIPIDAGGWHEEQVDELFASLLGRSQPQVDTGKGDSRPSDGNVAVGSLRIFG